MRKAKETEGRSCPGCGKVENQSNYGYNRSGTQRYKRKESSKVYTLNAKTRAYSEEIRSSAVKTCYSGVSGRGAGKLFGINKANVYNRIKKPYAIRIYEQTYGKSPDFPLPVIHQLNVYRKPLILPRFAQILRRWLFGVY